MNKLWKAAGILGGMLVVTAGSGTLVLADETSTEVTDDNSGSSVLDTDEWAQKAAANVTDYANIRQEGSKESERVGVLPKGAAAQVIEQQGRLDEDHVRICRRICEIRPSCIWRRSKTSL